MPSRRPCPRRALLTGLAAGAGALVLSATAHAAVRDGGVVLAGNVEDPQAQVQRAKAAGVPWVSLSVSWAALEPQPDSHLALGGRTGRAWAQFEGQVDAASRAGLKVLVVMKDAPEWASGRDAVNDPPIPAHYGDYAAFLGELTGILGTRVHAIAPWNEPNLPSFWANPDAGAYAALQRAAYPAIKAVAPRVQVMLAPISGVGGSPYRYLEDVYAAGVRGSADIVGWNSYPPTNPEDAPRGTDGRPVPGALAGQRVVAGILRRVDPGRRVWITEISWSTCLCGGLNVASPAVQADNLVRTFSYKRRYLTPAVDRVFWYNLRDGGDRRRWSSNHGLTYANLKPKPAFHQLRLIDRTLRVPVGVKRQARRAVSTPGSSVPGLRVRSVSGRLDVRGRVRVDGRSRLLLEGFRRGSWRRIGASNIGGSSAFAARPADLAYLAIRVRVSGSGERGWARRVAIVPKGAPLRTSVPARRTAARNR